MLVARQPEAGDRRGLVVNLDLAVCRDYLAELNLRKFLEHSHPDFGSSVGERNQTKSAMACNAKLIPNPMHPRNTRRRDLFAPVRTSIPSCEMAFISGPRPMLTTVGLAA